MRKKMVRILALILCAVMILGMISMIVNAEEIQPKHITQHRNEYSFTTLEDLVELAAGTYSEWTTFEYTGEGELVIDEDLTLPAGTYLTSWDNAVRIEEGTTVEADEVNCPLIVDGTLTCRQVEVNVWLEVNGMLCVEEGIQVWGDEYLEGLENIVITNNPEIHYTLMAFSVEEMLVLAEETRNQTDPRVVYQIWVVDRFDLTESVVFADNASVQLDYPMTVVAGAKLKAPQLNFNKQLTVLGEVEVEELSLYAPMDQLIVEAGGSLTADRICVYYSEGSPDLDTCLSGLDLDSYVVHTENEGLWILEWAGADAETTPGDLDGNDIVDDADVALLLWHTLFPETYEIVGEADLNGDGEVDDADVAYLLWHTLFPDAYPL